jgi:hypothetical protein
VNIVLVEADLHTNSISPPSPCAKFKLGSEKYRSRVLSKTCRPKWIEQFDLHLYDENFQQLDVMLQDRSTPRNEVLGRLSIDLRQLEKERTHETWYELRADKSDRVKANVLLLITISQRTTAMDTTSMNGTGEAKEHLASRYVGVLKPPLRRLMGQCGGIFRISYTPCIQSVTLVASQSKVLQRTAHNITLLGQFSNFQSAELRA